MVTLTIAEGVKQGTFNIDVFGDGVLAGDRVWPIIVKELNTVPGLANLTLTELQSNPFNIMDHLGLREESGYGFTFNGLTAVGTSTKKNA